MAALTKPQGPLPPHVYWVRRAMVLGTAFLLVFAVVRLFGTGEDQSSTPVTAKQAASVVQPTGSAGPSTSPTPSPSVKVRLGKKAKKAKLTPPPPSGPCLSEDVVITGAVKKAHGGADIPLDLVFRSTDVPACTFTVSPDTITAQITSGHDEIWTSRECRKAITPQDITVYRDFDTVVPIIWHGRRSDATCSNQALWALPGTYHLAVSPYAGEPTDTRFELRGPKPVIVTRSPKPTPGAGVLKSPKPKSKPAATAAPSGAVEPNG